MMMATMTTVCFYMVTAYTPTFGSTVLHLAASGNLIVTLCVGACNFLVLPLSGALSDRIGRPPILIACTIAALLTAYPALAWLVSAPSFSRLLTVELWLSFLYAGYNGAMAVYLTEIMPAEVRISGFSLAYSLATAVFGGFTPAICTYLIHVTGNRAVPGSLAFLRRGLRAGGYGSCSRIARDDGGERMADGKEALVLLPGLLCDRAVWQHQLEALSDIADCTSIEWGNEDSLVEMAQTALRQAPGRFSLAGHSMGGRVALEVFRLAPERVARIALFNTGYQPRPQDAAGRRRGRGRLALLAVARSEGMRAMATQWLPPMIHPDRRTDLALVNTIIDMFARKTPDTFAAQIRALLGRPDATGVLEQIRCPALLLTGREDDWSPPARHAEMAAKIPGSQLVVIPECGHMSMLERPRSCNRGACGRCNAGNLRANRPLLECR